jgi:hypothetical protein
MGKTAFKFGWTGNGLLATASNGFVRAADRGAVGRAAGRPAGLRRRTMYTVLIVLLILMLVGALPVFPYATSWGWSPAAIVLVVLIVLLLLRVL